ncbi:hypothetical protein EON63_12940 [archaeon]|nr:MAG: hypothetical protein EON63_12940 [archaeon]
MQKLKQLLQADECMCMRTCISVCVVYLYVKAYYNTDTHTYLHKYLYSYTNRQYQQLGGGYMGAICM